MGPARARGEIIGYEEPQMRWLRTAVSLRAKITATFTLIVVGGTVASTLIGSRIITDALLNQARTRGLQGLEAARTVYADHLAAVKGSSCERLPPPRWKARSRRDLPTSWQARWPGPGTRLA